MDCKVQIVRKFDVNLGQFRCLRREFILESFFVCIFKVLKNWLFN